MLWPNLIIFKCEPTSASTCLSANFPEIHLSSSSAPLMCFQLNFEEGIIDCQTVVGNLFSFYSQYCSGQIIHHHSCGTIACYMGLMTKSRNLAKETEIFMRSYSDNGFNVESRLELAVSFSDTTIGRKSSNNSYRKWNNSLDQNFMHGLITAIQNWVRTTRITWYNVLSTTCRFMADIKFHSNVTDTSREKICDTCIDSGVTHRFFHHRQEFLSYEKLTQNQKRAPLESLICWQGMDDIMDLQIYNYSSL